MKYKNSVYREFLDCKDAQTWAALHYAESKQVIDENSETRDAIEHYCGYSYRPMNGFLRGFCCGIDKKENTAWYQNGQAMWMQRNKLLIDYLQTQILPEAVVAYRFVSKWYLQEILQRKKGFHIFPDIVLEQGFCSTTLCKKAYVQSADSHFDNGSICLQLLLPAGTRAGYTTFIAGRPQEQELLLMPCCEFKVLRRSPCQWKLLLILQAPPVMI